MNDNEETALRDALVLAIKELGEIAECVVKADGRPDHWKYEVCDLCGLAIQPMLDVAGISYNDACKIGVDRKLDKWGGVADNG